MNKPGWQVMGPVLPTQAAEMEALPPPPHGRLPSAVRSDGVVIWPEDFYQPPDTLYSVADVYPDGCGFYFTHPEARR